VFCLPKESLWRRRHRRHHHALHNELVNYLAYPAAAAAQSFVFSSFPKAVCHIELKIVSRRFRPQQYIALATI
jgi:hypothetical protein